MVECRLAGWHRGSIQQVCVMAEDLAISWDARGVLNFWDLQRARLASSEAASSSLRAHDSIAVNGEVAGSAARNGALFIHRPRDFGDPVQRVKLDGRAMWPCDSTGLVVLLDERSLQRLTVHPTGLSVQAVGVTVVHDEPVVCAVQDTVRALARLMGYLRRTLGQWKLFSNFVGS